MTIKLQTDHTYSGHLERLTIKLYTEANFAHRKGLYGLATILEKTADAAREWATEIKGGPLDA